ncbi:MAG: hypothetical protein KAI24_24465, partial [Planctomycetes bacterium]|nr:hypothetical protein [Planctomycetota bacterium]
ILAIFRNQQQASRAARDLEEAGFPPESISVLAADSASGQAFMATERTSAKKGALAGAALGSTGGLVAGSLVGIGAILTGPIIGVLAGSVAGGLLGGLVGLGIPENEALLRSQDIQDGAILVAVDVPDEQELEALALTAIGTSDYQRIVSVDDPVVREDRT